MSTPEKHPGQGGPRRGASVQGTGWGRVLAEVAGGMRGAGAPGAPGVPAVGGGTQCSAGVQATLPGVCVQRKASRHSSLFGFPPPASQRLSYPCLSPDISREQMEGDYNEDLCVFRAGLVSQYKGAGIAASHFHFHSRFGSAVWRGGACLRGGGLITGLCVSRRASRLGEGLANGASPPAGLEPASTLNPALFLPPLTPPPPRPLLLGPPCILCLPFSLPFSGLRKRPLPLALAPFCSLLQGLPGEGTPWPGPTRRRQVPGSGSGESAEPRHGAGAARPPSSQARSCQGLLRDSNLG